MEEPSPSLPQVGNPRCASASRNAATASVALILLGTQLALGTAAAPPLVLVEASVQTPGSGGHGHTRMQQNQRVCPTGQVTNHH